MRPTCSDCAKKHLSQATILLSEAKRGYPLHRTLALGHMAEAEEELIKEYPIQANQIRSRRIVMEKNPKGNNDMMQLIEMVDRECDSCAANVEICPTGKNFNHKLGKCV